MRARVEALDRSPFGLNCHQASDLLKTFAEIGIRWFRFDVDWDEVEPARARYRWDVVDAMCDEASRLGVSLLASVAYTPRWARGAPDRGRAAPPTDVHLYTDFIAAFGARYSGRIACIGIWNEPDLPQFWAGSRQQYLSLLVAGLRTARDAAPTMVRCGPDLSGWSRSTRRFLEQVLAATDVDSAGPLLEVITHHQYGGRNDTPGERVKMVEDLHALLGKRDPHRRDLWITETGWNTGQVPLEQIARNLRDTMQAMLARSGWWTKTFWYDSHGEVQGRPGKWWGLLAPTSGAGERARTPALEAYSREIAAIAGPPPPLPPEFDSVQALRILNAAYQGVLGRPVDPDGVRTYLDQARRGDIVSVCSALLASPELAGQRVTPDQLAERMFKGIFGRTARRDDLRETAAAIRAGHGAQRVAAMLRSPEFRRKD
jgi:hypothetical protein